MDRTADGVVSGLTERGVPVMRVDLSWFPQRLTLDAEFRDGSWHGNLRTEHHQVDLATVRSVWVRTPSSFQMPVGMSEVERESPNARPNSVSAVCCWHCLTYCG
ncbi:MAG: MvdC/MvdD family ATP grasp protein [Pseudonocardiaceae bacterium]